MSLALVYVDNHLLAANKPAGLPTQDSEHHGDSLEAQAKAWVKAEFAKPGAVFLQPVHRLDLPVGGLVLFARTSKALSRLNAAMRERLVGKEYLALVEGRPAAPAGTLRHWLRHGDFRAELLRPGSPQAQEAILDYDTLAAAEGLSLLAVTLRTGRYHQIRAQLAAAGCPILGDRKYGARRELGGGAIGLHHWRLTVPHPVGERELCLTARPPAIGPWRQPEFGQAILRLPGLDTTPANR